MRRKKKGKEEQSKAKQSKWTIKCYYNAHKDILFIIIISIINPIIDADNDESSFGLALAHVYWI